MRHHFSGRTMQAVRWALPLAGCVALLLGIGGLLRGRMSSPSAQVMVRFTLEAPSAARVSLAGDWNGWRPGQLNLKAGQNGVSEVIVPLRAGRIYTYDFLIDGQRWVPDLAISEAERRLAPGVTGRPPFRLGSARACPSGAAAR